MEKNLKKYNLIIKYNHFSVHLKLIQYYKLTVL